MRYVSIDIETTGLDPKFCQVLELGMVLEDTERDTPLNALPHFSIVFHHEEIHGEHYALNMHAKSGLLCEVLERPLVKQKDPWVAVNNQLKDWRQEHTRGDRLIAAGKNVAGFDLQFFPSGVRDNFSHRTIDPGSVFIDWATGGLPSLGYLKQCLGIKGNVAHRALEDARDVIRVLRKAYR